MPENVSRAAFAAIFGVDKAQVTRWAADGMPANPDGTLDPEIAAAWVRRNVDPTQRNARSVGAIADRRGEQLRKVDAADTLTGLGIWLLAQRIPAAVAEMAVAVGADIDLARRLHDLAITRAAELAAQTGRLMDLPEPGPEVERNRVPTIPAADWPALAAIAGQNKGATHRQAKSKGSP